MKVLLALALTLVNSTAFAQAATSSRLDYIGTASSPDTGIPVYTEAYAEHYDASGKLLQTQVQYRDAQGNAIADKQLDYQRHPHAPAFTFVNHKTGYRETVSWLDDGRIRLSHADSPQAPAREKILAVPEPVVADAGFNQFVRAHLPQLEQGQTVSFHFLNPARLDWFRFTARGEPLDTSTLQVTIAPASRILQWLVEPIRLTYARDSGRLLRYEGLTNISLEGGNTLVARIEYRYAEKTVEFTHISPEG